MLSGLERIVSYRFLKRQATESNINHDSRRTKHASHLLKPKLVIYFSLKGHSGELGLVFTIMKDSGHQYRISNFYELQELLYLLPLKSSTKIVTILLGEM